MLNGSTTGLAQSRANHACQHSRYCDPPDTLSVGQSARYLAICGTRYTNEKQKFKIRHLVEYHYEDTAVERQRIVVLYRRYIR